MCLERWRRLLQWNLRHHFIERRAHGLDQFWTVARHETPPFCAGTVAGLLLTGQTQSRERIHASVSAFALTARSCVIAMTYSRRAARRRGRATPQFRTHWHCGGYWTTSSLTFATPRSVMPSVSAAE